MSAVCDYLFNIVTATFPYWRPFLHPQPDDMSCRGDRGPIITALLSTCNISWEIKCLSVMPCYTQNSIAITAGVDISVNIMYDRSEFRKTRCVQEVQTRDLAQVWSPTDVSFRARIAKIGNGNNISHNTSTVKVSRSSVSVPGTVEFGGRTYGISV